MPHDDVRQIGNHLELFQDGKQTTIAGDPIVFTEADAEALRNEFYDQTDFAEKYAWTPENLAVLTRVSAKLNRFNPMPNAITRSRIVAAYLVANAAGGACGDCGTLEKVAEEPEPTTAPLARDEGGRFKNQLVAEYEAMVNDPNVHHSVITERLRTDRPFREAVEASRLPKPQRPTEEHVVEEEIGTSREFADAFRRAPAPKFLNGRVTIGLQEYTPVELDAAIEKASRLNLL